MRLALTAAAAADGLYPTCSPLLEVDVSHEPIVLASLRGSAWGSLPGPSRTITVEPIELPVQPAPLEPAAPAPTEPATEPVPDVVPVP